MTEKKELNNEELNKVAGGYDGDNYDDCSYNQISHSAIIDKYDAPNYIGQKVLAVHRQKNTIWFYGTLTDSYEKSKACGTTVRTHTIIVENLSYRAFGEGVREKESFSTNSDWFELYSMN